MGPLAWSLSAVDATPSEEKGLAPALLEASEWVGTPVDGRPRDAPYICQVIPFAFRGHFKVKVRKKDEK